MTFAEQLQAARAAAGLSQSQAALPLIAVGIIGSVRTLQNWELGRGETLPAYKQSATLAALRPPKKARKHKGQNVPALAQSGGEKTKPKESNS
jgi:hypothetical protein